MVEGQGVKRPFLGISQGSDKVGLEHGSKIQVSRLQDHYYNH